MTKLHSWKKWTVAFIFISLLLPFLPTASAISLLGPIERNYNADAGETISDSVTLQNTYELPQLMLMEVDNFKLDPVDQSKRIYGVDISYGMKDWIEFSNGPSRQADPDEKIKIDYIINVPEDAEPGTYMAAMFLYDLNIDTVVDDMSGVGMASRIMGNLYLTVSGDFDETLELKSFELDKEKFKDGAIIFNTELENTGNVSIIGTGTITLFDSSGQQIMGVNAITKNFDGEELVEKRTNKLIVNQASSPILQSTTGTYRTAWTHRQADEGTYTAKLDLFYGQESKQYSAELEFEIAENFAILDLKSEKLLSTSLPLSFEAKLANTGNINLSPEGYFEIRNLFGSQKHRIDINDLTILGGEEVELENLKWESGFALGLYSANLYLDVNGQIFEKASFFWVLTWWQILIILIVVVTFILLVTKGVSRYKKMTKRIKGLEKEVDQKK